MYWQIGFISPIGLQSGNDAAATIDHVHDDLLADALLQGLVLDPTLQDMSDVEFC